jgi:nitrate/TMAO reductase-like tetraheme cytochrome c subunit
MRLMIGILIAVSTAALVPASAAELSSKEIKDAKKIYIAKCAKCHKFYDPAAYDQAEWDEWMQKMREKSKLKVNQFELLTRYLETIRGSVKTPEK